MTHEERASWIRSGVVTILLLVVAALAWFLPDFNRKPETETMKPQRLVAVLYQLPGSPESDALSAVMDHVEPRYAAVVEIQRVDVTREREKAVAAGVTKVPHVIVLNGQTPVGAFTGQLDQAQVEAKLNEILHGLKRVDKNWRPAVAGMSSAGH